jgi:hypothetical protein
LTIKHLTFLHNVAPDDGLGGGAILIDSCVDVKISSSNFSSNRSPYSDGGAIAIHSIKTSSVVSMTDCQTEANVAQGHGGAVFVGRTGVLAVASTHMEGDIATEGGGAVTAFAATLSIENVTILSSSSALGALQCIASSLQMYQSTVYNTTGMGI